MKKYINFLFGFFVFINGSSGQITNTYFDNVWQGFNTGFYPEGRFLTAIKAADLDNDGDLDVVASKGIWGTGFVILKNLGNGNYSSPTSYTTVSASYDVSLADFNADGLKDVVVSNAGVNNNGTSISVFLNTGSAVFGSPLNLTVGLAPIGLATADLDADGDIDIAVCNKSNATVSILRNNGNATFDPAVSFAAGNNPYKIVVSNINAGSQPDLVIANEGNQKLNILFNTGTATFSTRVEYNVLSPYATDLYACVESADLDNDGYNDILYSSTHTWNTSNGYIAYFKNNGDGTLAAVQTLPLTANTGGATDIEIADLNQDGWKDIIGNYYSGGETDTYQVLMNNGSGGFLPAVARSAGAATFAITSGDVNGDGKIDILTADRNSMQITVHKNPGTGIFLAPVLYNTLNDFAGAIDASDIDSDGDLDIVTSAASTTAVGVHVTVLKNNGNGTFANAIAYSIGGGGVRAKFRDLNGDGIPDLLFATSISTTPYNFHTALNNGDGTFGARQTWAMNACGWSDIDAIDMDNDGDKDVVITERLGCIFEPLSSRRIYISTNNGSGSFSAPLIKIVNPSPSCLAFADFNADGNQDLVTGHSLSIDIHFGTGTGDIQAPVSYATGQSPYAIIVRDFNNDGKPDIAACTKFNYEGMSVLLGIGNGTFQPALNYFGAYSPNLRNVSGITSGDIDNDGDIDIMVSNWASNDLSVYLNDGTGNFVFDSRLGAYYGAEAPIFAEFTGDCKPDLLVGVLKPFNFNNGGAITILKGNNICVVPVRLIELKAATATAGIEVSWKVSNEENLSKYEIGKSIDGRNFEKIGEVVSRNRIELTNYSFLDVNPNKGFNYYRLTMVDINGSKKYSAIVLINLKTTGKLSMTIAPNPSNTQSTVTISGNLRGKATIAAYDISGRIVVNLYSGEINSNVFATTLNLSVLKSGFYILKLTINGETVTQKLLIQ